MDISLKHILEVYRLAARNLYTFDDALREVGKQNNIESSVLLSSCTTTLNISNDAFENFLKSENSFNFKNFLVRRFPEHHSEILRFFNIYENACEIPVLDLTKVFKKSALAKSPTLNNHIMVNELENSFQDWIARNDVPQDMKDELKGWIRKIEGFNK